MAAHRARPAHPEDPETTQPCGACRREVKQVPGGQGVTWVHAETGTVVGPGRDPKDDPSEAQVRSLMADPRFMRDVYEIAKPTSRIDVRTALDAFASVLGGAEPIRERI